MGHTAVHGVKVILCGKSILLVGLRFLVHLRWSGRMYPAEGETRFPPLSDFGPFVPKWSGGVVPLVQCGLVWQAVPLSKLVRCWLVWLPFLQGGRPSSMSVHRALNQVCLVRNRFSNENGRDIWTNVLGGGLAFWWK